MVGTRLHLQCPKDSIVARDRSNCDEVRTQGGQEWETISTTLPQKAWDALFCQSVEQARGDA
jgi:hypothetical protein